MTIVVDHIGYAVKDIDRAKNDFEKLGFQFDEAVVDKDRNLYIQFGYNSGYCIELIQTINEDEYSPVKYVLKKTNPRLIIYATRLRILNRL